MKRRTMLEGSAGLAASWFMGGTPRGRQDRALSRDGLPSWTAAAREYVQVQQERRYRDLARQMGLNGDARAAYARLSPGPMPASHLASDKLRQGLGAEGHLTKEQWTQLDATVGRINARYAALEPPTEYEEATRYRSLVMTFDQVQSLAAGSAPAAPAPLLATLASGDVNALIEQEPETEAPIIFFELGLFRFLYDFALLAGWAAPPLSPQQLTDDAALAGIAGEYTMPMKASEIFLGTLYAYAVDGTWGGPSPIPLPRDNIFTSMFLLDHMERFAMAHELSHLRLGHLAHPYQDDAQAWQQEFDADAEGLALASEPQPGAQPAAALALWAADVALTALHFLDFTLCVMAHGGRRAWVSKTHPDMLSRRQRLRERGARVPDIARAAAKGLFAMNDALFGRLWELAVPMLLLLRETRNARPAPLWRQRIAAVYASE